MTGEVSTASMAVTSHDVNSKAALSVDCQQLILQLVNTERGGEGRGGRDGGGREGRGGRKGGWEGGRGGREGGEGGEGGRGGEGGEGGMTVIHILICMFNSNPMIPQYLNKNLT